MIPIFKFEIQSHEAIPQNGIALLVYLGLFSDNKIPLLLLIFPLWEANEMCIFEQISIT